MNRPLPHRARPQRTPSVLRCSPIAAAVSTLILGTPLAHAQQTGADSTQTVVVTGIRRSIESSIATKRNATSVVEAISAEDIGKLPDVSIAESLARLPGLAGQRVAGRAQVIAIRGLSPDFAGTLLNGRQQVTTGDNRSVEYDQFPSELINAATVYKTPDATLVGQGLSGTIDLQTIRPLDMPGRSVVLNARLESNSNGSLNAGSSGKGNRLSFSYVDQFADRTIGVAIGLAHLDSLGQELHYKAWGFGKLNADCTAHPDWGCSQATGVPAGATVQSGFEATATSRKQTRDGLMAVLEYKPNKDLRSSVDLYYSKFKKDEDMRGLMNGLAEGWSGNPGVAYTNARTTQVGQTQLVTSANLANANMIVRNDKNTRDDELKALGWNLTAQLADKWKGVADLSYSSAERHENVIETYAGARAASGTTTTQTYGTFAMNIPSGAGFPTFTPGLNYADANTIYLSDPAHDWGHDGLWKKPRVKDEMKSLRLEARRDLDGLFSGVDFGLNYTTRQKDREMNEIAAMLKNKRAPTLVPAGLIQSPTSLSFAGIPGVLAYDVMGALGSLYDLVPQAVDQVINRNYEVKEKVTTAYVKAGIDTMLGSMGLTGNVGVQFVHTDQSSHGYSKLANIISENTRGTTYDDVLPSLNLSLDLSSASKLRLGVAKTLARGRMDDMKAGADVSIDVTKRTWSGSGGNPELKPWRATSFDLSLEHYIDKRSYVAFAAFHKKLASYIYTKETEIEFTGFPNTTNIQPVSAFGLFKRPENGQGGSLKGLEFSTSMDAGTFVKALEGFGVVASLSRTFSKLQPDGPGTTTRLPGLSGTAANLTVYYETGGFSTRISERYRSNFRGEVNGLHNARSFTEIQADRQVDFQIGYEFGGGALKGLSVLLQVNNLSNSPYATRQGNGFTGDVIAPEEYNKYGRQTLIGVNYKL